MASVPRFLLEPKERKLSETDKDLYSGHPWIYSHGFIPMDLFFAIIPQKDEDNTFFLPSHFSLSLATNPFLFIDFFFSISTLHCHLSIVTSPLLCTYLLSPLPMALLHCYFSIVTSHLSLLLF